MNNLYTVISFPALGIRWDPIRSFSVGPLEIHLYGLIIAMGLLLAVLYTCRRSRQFGISADDLTDGVLWITPFAIICARLYYCIFFWEEGGYGKNPISILYIWEGGLAIYGGVIGAIIGMAVFSRIKKLKLTAVLDVVALGFLIGQAIGRWGNFFNREAFGAETECFLRMGLYNVATGVTEYHHPTFLYESVWNAAGFVILHFWSRHRKYDGQIALGYAAWYGLGRAVIEGLRTDSLYWGPFRVSQLLAAMSCLVAVIVLVYLAVRPNTAGELFVHQVERAAAQPDQKEQPTETEETDHE